MSLTPTEEQEEVIRSKSGLFAVRACPGSGKTYCVAARLNRLLMGWNRRYQGIAVISFTNVAWQEITEYLAKDFSRQGLLCYPHFLGTIDSFINKYIFLPFGHLVMECEERPRLFGPPHDGHEPIGSWMWWGKSNTICNTKGCRIGEFTFDHDGHVIHQKHKNRGETCQHNNRSPCVEKKRVLRKAGFATQADANYFALQILRKFPDIARSLARRFPVVMIDEAQDTSRIQMSSCVHSC